MSQSQSCTFNSNPATCLETPPQSPANTSGLLPSPANNNFHIPPPKKSNSMSEHSNESTSTTESETGKQATNVKDASAAAAASKSQSSKPKWKPLLIDAPKRERKSYRPPGNGARSAYRTSGNDLSTSADENTATLTNSRDG